MKNITDHEGNHYRTIKDMCEHYGIKPYVYQQRRRAGWSMREALTKPVATYVRTTKGVRDHLGNFYPTVKAMCKAYNIAEATYHRRRRQGASMEEALEHKSSTNHKRCKTILVIGTQPSTLCAKLMVLPRQPIVIESKQVEHSKNA